MNDKTLNYGEFDILRGFGIWIVLLAHNIFYQISSFNSPGFELAFTFMRFFGVAMPIFFFVAAYSSVRVSLRNPYYFLTSRFKFVGIPYLIWSTFYILMQYLLRNSVNLGIKPSFLDILGYYILGSSISEYYFIFVLMIFYIVTPLLVRIDLEVLQKLSIVSFVLMMISSSVYYIPNYFGKHLMSTFWACRDPFMWFFFYLLGIQMFYIVKDKGPFWRKPLDKKYIFLSIIFYGLSLLEFYFMPDKYADGLSIMSPIVLTFSIFFIPLLLRFSYLISNELPYLAKIFGKFGRHTLGIYLANGFVEGLILGLGMIFYPPFKNTSSLGINLLMFVVALLISYIMVTAVWKINKRIYALIF